MQITMENTLPSFEVFGEIFEVQKKAKVTLLTVEISYTMEL